MSCYIYWFGMDSVLVRRTTGTLARRFRESNNRCKKLDVFDVDSISAVVHCVYSKSFVDHDAQR